MADVFRAEDHHLNAITNADLRQIAPEWLHPAVTEVVISDTDPLAEDPTTELWYQPTGVGAALWDATASYMAGASTQWPADKNWIALRNNSGEEPGVWPHIPAGVDFHGVDAQVEGLTAVIADASIAEGYDVRFGTDNSIKYGTPIGIGAAGFFSQLYTDQTDFWIEYSGSLTTARQAIANFSAVTYVRVVFDTAASTFTFYGSADGIDWTSAGTPVAAEPHFPSVLSEVRIAHNGVGGGINYPGMLTTVEVYSLSGSLLSSWKAGSQPNADGTGAAPTGETYAQAGLNPGTPVPANGAPWEALAQAAPTGILRANVNGVWEVVGSSVAALDDLTDVDTTTTAPADGDGLVWDAALGQWVPGAPAASEVEITDIDPLATNPVVELWYTPAGPTTATPFPLWNPTVAYQTLDDVSMADGTSWRANRPTLPGEQPQVLAIPPGIDFIFPATEPNGVAATIADKNITSGYDLRFGFDGKFGNGTWLNAFDFGQLFWVEYVPSAGLRFNYATASNVYQAIQQPIDFINNVFIRIVLDSAAGTVTFHKSVDGATWTTVGTPHTMQDAHVPGPLKKVEIAHSLSSGTPDTNYSGVLTKVEIYDLTGTPVTSWVAGTQPTPDGTGVSPLTGESYTQVGTVPGVPIAVPEWTWTGIPTPTAGVAGILRANVNGVWEDVTSEVVLAIDDLTDVDTTTVPPVGGDGLVWDATLSQWVPGAPLSALAFWDPVVNYVTDDKVLWPEVSPISLWKARRDNINEEPVEPTAGQVPGFDFTTSGLSGSIFPTIPDFSAGFETVILLSGPVGTSGEFFYYGPQMGGISFRLYINGADLVFGAPTSSGGPLTNYSTPLAGWDSVANPYLKVACDLTNVVFGQSADGSAWTDFATVATPGAVVSDTWQIGLGNFYTGALASLETRNGAGTLQQSWVAATQDPATGTGVSPKTGEQYTGAAVPFIPGDPAWALVHTFDPATVIDDLDDVDTSTTPPADGETLVWDAASGQWVPGPGGLQISTDPDNEVMLGTDGGLYSNEVYVGPTGPTLDGPVDLWADPDAGVIYAAATGPTGLAWIPVGAPAASEVEVDDAEPTGDWEIWVDTSTQSPLPGAPVGLALDDLTDVVSSAPVDGNGLGWDSAASNWVPQGMWKSWSGTQAEYDALGTYDDNTLYAVI